MENAREIRVDPSALYRSIVQSADDAISSLDLNEVITSWNHAAEKLYGYAAKEVIGKSNRLIIPPDRYTEEDDIIGRVKSGEGVQHHDTVRVRKDGSRVEVAITASAIHDDGHIIGISKIARDITERKMAERNGARLAAIVESSDDAIVAKDLNGIITSWNRAAERMFGYSANEAIGQSIRLIIPESHQHEEDTIIGRIRRGESIQHFETIRCRKGGSCFPISVTISPIRDAAGTIIGASKIARDITERKHAEALAQRVQRQAEFVARMAEVLSGPMDYEARLKGLVEIAVPAMADWAALDTVEPDGRIRRLAVAHADADKTQLGAEVRRRFEDPITPCNARQVIRTGKSVLLPEVTDAVIVAAANGDDKRVGLMRALGLTSCVCVPLATRHAAAFAALTLATAESGRQYSTEDLHFAEDVASRAALMVDNARAYEALRTASGLKDEFLATLSHELRTPLNAILGYTRMLRAAMVKPDKLARTYETIERNTTSLTKMVEDILDVSRVVSGKMRLNMQPVELPLVIHEAVATVTPAAEAKDIRLETIVDPQVGAVSGDPDRLRQVIWNLLSNAVKFTPKHGRIQVRLERVNSSVEIVVSDTGIGIRPDFLPHIFERFRQADSAAAREHAGLGLGLAIVRNLVELHGGTVYATSGGEGEGATFRVRLPVRIVHPDWQPAAERVHPRSGDSAPPPSLEDLPSLSDTHVLAVDDDPDALRLLKEILEAVGATVTTARSSRAALEIIATDRPDVLVADLGMPLMDGFELIEQLRTSDVAAARDIPAAALTAYARSEDRAKALKSGFEMHLAKPIDPAELIAAVKALARRRPLPSA